MEGCCVHGADYILLIFVSCVFFSKVVDQYTQAGFSSLSDLTPIPQNHDCSSSALAARSSRPVIRLP